MPVSQVGQYKTDFKKILNDQGFCMVDPGYSQKTIEKWNNLLEQLFVSRSHEKRSYVLPAELFELGILQEVFNNEIKTMLKQIMPNPIFYHCHAYEIKSNQKQSHIYPKAKGWHRDEECVPFYNANQPIEISMFIYLTDVALENGPFEVRPKSPFAPLFPGEPTIQALGAKGTTFFFNRALYHRACPNGSGLRRRVLKFSFQPVTMENTRIRLKEFKDCQPLVKGDAFFEYLFGQYYGHPGAEDYLLPGGGENAQARHLPFLPNARLSVPLSSLAKMNVRAQLTRYASWLKLGD